MRILLDTHAFLWWDNDLNQLSERAKSFCFDPNNTLVLSVVSVWEMQIKHQSGKLTLRAPLAELVFNQQREKRHRDFAGHVTAHSGVRSVAANPQRPIRPLAYRAISRREHRYFER